MHLCNSVYVQGENHYTASDFAWLLALNRNRFGMVQWMWSGSYLIFVHLATWFVEFVCCTLFGQDSLYGIEMKFADGMYCMWVYWVCSSNAHQSSTQCCSNVKAKFKVSHFLLMSLMWLTHELKVFCRGGIKDCCTVMCRPNGSQLLWVRLLWLPGIVCWDRVWQGVCVVAGNTYCWYFSWKSLA